MEPVAPDEDAVVAGENVDEGIAVGVAEDGYMQESGLGSVFTNTAEPPKSQLKGTGFLWK